MLDLKSDLRRKIRECSLSGGEVLRSLDKAVFKLEDFVKIMQPLRQVISQLDEKSSSISRTLSQVRDLADLSREVLSLSNDLQNPPDSRHHLKNIDRAQTLLRFYQTHSSQQDSEVLKEKLLQGLSIGYSNCLKLFEEQVTRYNEIYGISPITQENTAQIDMIGTLMGFVSICRTKAPQYWQIYLKLRSVLIYKSVNVQKKQTEPYVKGNHNIILILENFVKSCGVEKELLMCILDTSTVQDLLGEVTDTAFQWLSSQTELFLSKKTHVTQSLDIMTAFNSYLTVLEEDLGKSVKYYTLSKLQTTLLQRCQLWYREYIQYIQSTKIYFGDFVHEMSVQLVCDLKRLEDYKEGLVLAKLEQSVSHLVTSLIDTFRIKIKTVNEKKHQGLSHMFMINNLSYWIHNLQEIEFVGAEDVMARIEREMIAEIEEYCKAAWAKLQPVLSETPNVIEFKKPGVLTRGARKAVKTKFTAFNTYYTDIFNYHKNFSVFSKEILQLLRKKNYAIIVPAYKEFMKKYLAVDFTTRREKYTIYPIENVEQGILNMYSLKHIMS